LGTVKVVLTDFERTLVRLFEDSSIEQHFLEKVAKHCARFGVPPRVLRRGRGSPYSLWMEAYRWMKHRGLLHADSMYQIVSKTALEYELDAAESIRLFDDVPPVLEQLKVAGIPVVIVSNNATAAVERVLENNDAKRLVDHVIGREFTCEMIGILKPKPNLVVNALKYSRHEAGTALLVGDSVDDMRAGKAANIGFSVGLLQHSTASKRQLRRAGARLVLNRFGDLQHNEEVQWFLRGADESGDR
jgi:phosphoglycolate phosphatase-like HAD superfamily hydrolase